MHKTKQNKKGKINGRVLGPIRLCLQLAFQLWEKSWLFLGLTFPVWGRRKLEEVTWEVGPVLMSVDMMRSLQEQDSVMPSLFCSPTPSLQTLACVPFFLKELVLWSLKVFPLVEKILMRWFHNTLYTLKKSSSLYPLQWHGWNWRALR